MRVLLVEDVPVLASAIGDDVAGDGCAIDVAGKLATPRAGPLRGSGCRWDSESIARQESGT